MGNQKTIVNEGWSLMWALLDKWNNMNKHHFIYFQSEAANRFCLYGWYLSRICSPNKCLNGIFHYKYFRKDWTNTFPVSSSQKQALLSSQPIYRQNLLLSIFSSFHTFLCTLLLISGIANLKELSELLEFASHCGPIP